MRTILPVAFLLVLAVLPGLPSCNDGSGMLTAKIVVDRGELVGGTKAAADVGDFLLENDQIKVNILGPRDSPGPGVFGGSLVDADVRRDRLGFEGGQGHDRFSELFPVANLLVPDPTTMQVTVLKDGKDGKEASIRAEGTGAFLFEALSILESQKKLLEVIFPDVKTKFHFRTDYIVRPGDRHVTIRSTILIDENQQAGCKPADASCDPAKCEFGFKADEKGCISCDCESPLPLDPYFAPGSVFGAIFGDNVNETHPPPKNRSGMVAGDFVFFGGENAIFAPGIGYDEEKAVNEAFYSGRNTFQQPLAFDYVAASAGDVSYGYFTATAPGQPTPVVNVPIFSGAATAMLGGYKTCTFDPADAAACDWRRAFVYERYFAVGTGDISSVAEEVFKVRGTKTGRVKGVVQSAQTGEASPRAHVFVLRDPAPGKPFATVDDLAEANIVAFGNEAVVTAIDANTNLDPVADGGFEGAVQAGDYFVVARSEKGDAISAPVRVHVDEGKTTIVDPALPTAATLDYRVTDGEGLLLPAKITLVALDDNGVPLERDGRRRVYLGDSRLADGVRAVDYSPTGEGELRIEPGHYRIRASRGPEYGIFERDVTLAAGDVQRVQATLDHEIDTTGWMSADMHVHSVPSHDSGMSFERRMSTIVAENVELAIPTDHDVESDYTPTIRSMLLEPYLSTAIGAETTTIEQGHFISFPQKYDEHLIPTHGAVDPTCFSGREILDALRKNALPAHEFMTIVAHPRDGFFGYIDQFGVDPFTMKRTLGLLEEKNPVFRTASCEFDAMEVINGKRFDLDRTATVVEVIDYNRCRARLDKAKTEDELKTVCPELSKGLLAACKPGERFAVCQHRNRSALTWQSIKRILTRTPEEQEALWNFPTTAAVGAQLCSLAAYGTAPVPRDYAQQPCTSRSGQIDDYMRYVEHGMLKTQIASSDTHGAEIEPGSPRTYFKSPTDAPSALAIDDATKSMKAGHAFATYGPFVTASVDGKSFGEVVAAQGGGKATLDLKVQTASWFGVDRIEIYENGHLVNVVEPKSKTSDIVDFDGKIVLDVPAKRDSWIVIIAMGLEDRNLMTPVYLDVPFGEIQISKVTADAFNLIPVVRDVFTPIPILPDWYPIPAYAVTNPIYLDVGHDGVYNAPLALPEFCSVPCDPSAANTCPSDQKCLDEGLCGVEISATCDHRVAWPGNVAH